VDRGAFMFRVEQSKYSRPRSYGWVGGKTEGVCRDGSDTDWVGNTDRVTKRHIPEDSNLLTFVFLPHNPLLRPPPPGEQSPVISRMLLNR
jgi:hypothetical protein